MCVADSLTFRYVSITRKCEKSLFLLGLFSVSLSLIRLFLSLTSLAFLVPLFGLNSPGSQRLLALLCGLLGLLALGDLGRGLARLGDPAVRRALAGLVVLDLDLIRVYSLLLFDIAFAGNRSWLLVLLEGSSGFWSLLPPSFASRGRSLA